MRAVHLRLWKWIVLINVVRPKRERKPRQPTEQITTRENEIALIADYLALSLTPRVFITFEADLQACRDCATFLRTYKKTIEFTRAFLEIQPFTNGATRSPYQDGHGNVH